MKPVKGVFIVCFPMVLDVKLKRARGSMAPEKRNAKREVRGKTSEQPPGPR